MKPLILAGALLLLAFGGRTARTQQNSMPVTAETRNKAKLPAAGADTLIDSLPRGPGIVWLDKTTLLRFSLLPHAPGSLLSFHVVKWDTVGKKEIPAGNLPQWFAETNGDSYSIQVSPDGKYLLWTGEKVGPQRLPRPNIYYFAVITDVAGETKYECPIDDIGFIPKYPERWYGGSFADKLRWLPDSSHWIEFVSQNYRRNTPGALLVREITAAKVVKTLSIDPAAKNKAPGIPSLYGGKWITLRAGGGIRSSYDETQTSRLVLQNDKFSLLGSDVMYLAVDKAAYNFWALSPDGSRILWVRHYFTLDDKQALPKEDRSFSEIWTADRHGKNKRRVLSIETTQDASRFPAIEDAQWIPDGKRISFQYAGTLYALPDKPE